MEIIRHLIKTIVVIVILAVFLEMLLPRGDMRRYVKMVMGLLIIVAVLQTATGVINSNLLKEIPDLTDASSGYAAAPLEDIMAAGQSLSDVHRQEAQRQYTEGIARQVMSLTALNETLNVIDTHVTLEDDSNVIGKITITCSTGTAQPSESLTRKDDLSAIQPVIISTTGKKETGDSGFQPTTSEMRAATDISNLVANFYNLRREQVEIEFQ